MATVAANIKIIDPLNLRLSAGTDRIRDLKEDKEMFKKNSVPTDGEREGLYRKTNEDYTKVFYEAMMTFNKSLNDKFDLSLMGATSFEDTKQSKNLWESNGLVYNGIFSTTNNKFVPSIGSYNDKGAHYNKSEALYSVYGSGQLAYNHFLYFDITARNDWTSRLPSYSRSFFYPSFGLGLVFTDALELPDWLTYGKVRASYAIVGNGTPDIYFANKEFSGELYSGKYYTHTFSDEVPPVTIVPEKTYSWEFGLDLKFLKGRAGLDFAYFTNETRNQILSVDVPMSSGAKKVKTNAGTVSNKGFELQLTGTPIQTKDFSWDATLNFSYTKSELKEFMSGLESYQIAYPWSGPQFLSMAGSPIYGIYIKKWKRDDNGNMLVKENGEYELEGSNSFYADAMPKFTGGFNTSFRYKDFTLNASIDGQIGGKIVSFTNNYLKASGAGKESLSGRDESYGGLPYYIETGSNKKVLLDSHNAIAPGNAVDGRVHHDGVVAPGVKADGSPNDVILAAERYYNMRYNYAATEDNIYDNTYFMMREISLTYQVPTSVYSKLKLQGLNVSLIGSNLFYIYKRVPNVSPESGLGTKAQNAYVEYTAYPNPRSFGFSLKARF